MKNVSIIIPTLNEEGNINALVNRIDNAMKSGEIGYEIIFIDDHSSDKTVEKIKKLSDKFPIQVMLKRGIKGKAQSIIEGTQYTLYDTICMIDSDLQYPPEVIPKMVDLVYEKKSDIVVGNRIEQDISKKRKLLSKTFKIFFGKLLHQLQVDVQSGLKVFKKEIIQRLTISPSPWTFDLEFLKKARSAGYKIGSVEIIFSHRHSGKTKINTIPAMLEIGLSAIKLKIIGEKAINFHPNYEKEKGKGFHFRGIEFIPYNTIDEKENALYRLSPDQIILLSVGVLLVILGLALNWKISIILLIALLTTLYFTDLLFNLYLIYRSYTNSPDIKIPDKELERNDEDNWPEYTVFCPLYKEHEVLPQFTEAMKKLDYPKDKLQIMLLLEEDDLHTINTASKLELPKYFQTEIIPFSNPKTKPKACNYGLQRATGEFCVIYDAEDIPDPLQLKKAVLGFAKSANNVGCIQAKLNYYNSKQNILTRVFTAEYSLWFDLILTGLQSINAPIPLGGTSNHFRTKELKKIGGWDAFNVTEDADLGIRLNKAGYQTAIIDSLTLEEANSNLLNWINQRSRWIKGYIQTYLVHMRHPLNLIINTKNSHLAIFQLVIGGKTLSLFINPIMWIMTIMYFAFRESTGEFIQSLFPPLVFYIGVTSFILGNFLYMYYYMIGCMKREKYDIVKYVFLVPFYWVAMSVAAWKALYQLVLNPHYWAKTNHGLHLKRQPSVKPL